jgi:cell division protein FtsB
MTDRELYQAQNAAALVASAEATIERQRAELARLNQRCRALTAERDRLRNELVCVHNYTGGILRAIRTTLSASGIVLAPSDGEHRGQLS